MDILTPKTTATVKTALEATTWCPECGAPMNEGQEECPAYGVLYRKKDVLRHVLDVMGLKLKPKGPNILVVDKDGHEVHL